MLPHQLPPLRPPFTCVTTLYQSRHKTSVNYSFHTICITFSTLMTESEIHVRAPSTTRTEGRPCRPRPLWFRFREDGSRSTAVSARGKGVDQYVPNLLHMNILLALSRNSDMLFENLKFYLNLVQNLLDLEIARISRWEFLASRCTGSRPTAKFLISVLCRTLQVSIVHFFVCWLHWFMWHGWCNGQWRQPLVWAPWIPIPIL
jgi:hypothetical protein